MSMTIREAVAEQIKKSAPVIAERVVNMMAEEVINKRVNALTSAMALLSTLEGDLKKIKPDSNSYKEDGSVLYEAYTKAQLDKKNQAVEKITKLEAAIAQALDQNNYDPLNKLIGSGAVAKD